LQSKVISETRCAQAAETGSDELQHSLLVKDETGGAIQRKSTVASGSVGLSKIGEPGPHEVGSTGLDPGVREE
jgi:hypothetical protein